jgi:hypothetical protein
VLYMIAAPNTPVCGEVMPLIEEAFSLLEMV